MSIYPSDMDDLRRTIMDVALLLAAAVVWTEHRGVVTKKECVQDAIDLLEEIREAER